MSRKYPKILRNRKQRIARRLKPRSWPQQAQPMFTGSNIQYEMADKAQAVSCGGIGAIHLLCQKIGLVDLLNERVTVLKRHLPYHESDHILNLAYNIIAGGMRIEDLELRRNDESFLNGLGAQRIPDPTTAGDFTRRFAPPDTLDLMEAINEARQRVWQEQPQGFLSRAVIDVDGTIAGTLGECKGGMSLSYKGIWGYAPLIVSSEQQISTGSGFRESPMDLLIQRCLVLEPAGSGIDTGFLAMGSLARATPVQASGHAEAACLPWAGLLKLEACPRCSCPSSPTVSRRSATMSATKRRGTPSSITAARCRCFPTRLMTLTPSG